VNRPVISDECAFLAGIHDEEARRLRLLGNVPDGGAVYPGCQTEDIDVAPVRLEVLSLQPDIKRHSLVGAKRRHYIGSLKNKQQRIKA